MESSLTGWSTEYTSLRLLDTTRRSLLSIRARKRSICLLKYSAYSNYTYHSSRARDGYWRCVQSDGPSTSHLYSNDSTIIPPLIAQISSRSNCPHIQVPARLRPGHVYPFSNKVNPHLAHSLRLIHKNLLPGIINEKEPNYIICQPWHVFCSSGISPSRRLTRSYC